MRPADKVWWCQYKMQKLLYMYCGIESGDGVVILLPPHTIKENGGGGDFNILLTPVGVVAVSLTTHTTAYYLGL